MRPVRVQVGSQTTSTVVPMDQYISPFNVGISVDLSAGASLTYTVEHTFENVFADGWNPASAKWYSHSSLAAKTASSDGNYAYPVSAIRLNVTVYSSGTATMNVLQAGITA